MQTKIFKKNNPPYICVPITGSAKEEILQQLETVIEHSPDLIEWRADFYTNLQDTDEVISIIKALKAKTSIPLLFTIRAEHEGGEKITLTDEEKVELLIEVCRQTEVEFVDFETSNGEMFVETIRDVSRKNNKQLILSYHNFSETPDNSELIERAKQAEAYGADIAKFAVMPHSKADVFQLLEVTREIDSLLDVPIITMSMGEVGGLSRIIGWAYGSVVTFGVGVQSSAPGQVPVGKLREAIEVTQSLVPSWE